jgi:hypothetical protein
MALWGSVQSYPACAFASEFADECLTHFILECVSITSVATARPITAPDGSTSGAVGKDIVYAAPTMCICTLHHTIF